MHTLKYAAAASVSAASLAALWGVGIEPRLIQRTRIEAPVPHLPPGWVGRRLALFADFQIGISFTNMGTARRAVRMAVAERPALALVAGDLVYKAEKAKDREGLLRAAADLLRPLTEAGVPTFAVLGNHDFTADEAAARHEQVVAGPLREALAAAGVRVLRNQAAPVTAPGSDGDEPLYVVGIGAHLPGKDDSRAAIAQVPADAPRIVFMHNPSSFAHLPPHVAPLALAGHTHGGQIRVPFRPTWTLGRLIHDWPNYVDGWIEGYGQAGNRLYVNRGIGFSLIPVRFACPPELTIVTLQAAVTAEADGRIAGRAGRTSEGRLDPRPAARTTQDTSPRSLARRNTGRATA